MEPSHITSGNPPKRTENKCQHRNFYESRSATASNGNDQKTCVKRQTDKMWYIHTTGEYQSGVKRKQLQGQAPTRTNPDNAHAGARRQNAGGCAPHNPTIKTFRRHKSQKPLREIAGCLGAREGRERQRKVPGDFSGVMEMF